MDHAEEAWLPVQLKEQKGNKIVVRSALGEVCACVCSVCLCVLVRICARLIAGRYPMSRLLVCTAGV